jgi:tRNA (guanine37-N1)-methyltransferase
MFKVDVLTLYPELFPGALGHSLAGKAKGVAWDLTAHNMRDFATNKHKSVDDTPAGGGAGMVLRADIVANALDSIADDTRPRLLMSPRGKPLTQQDVRKYTQEQGLVILCGRFEGVDQRVIDGRNLHEVSIGDYILSGGEPAALILLDAIIRLLPEVMGGNDSHKEESFENGLLEYPHYTRPIEFEGVSIPPVLSSGNHKAIAKWRHEESVKLTKARRPDLLKE